MLKVWGEIMDLISIFRICFYICLAFTILFFIISVVLFFLFDIKTIFNIRTGRAKQKTIKEMQAANNSTGRLRVEGKTLTSQLSKNDKKNTGKKRENIIVPPQTEPVKEQYVNQSKTPYGDGSENTTVLQPQAEPTAALSQPDIQSYDPGAQTTQQLSESDMNNIGYDNSFAYDNVPNVNFQIVKKLVVIHTDETIN